MRVGGRMFPGAGVRGVVEPVLVVEVGAISHPHRQPGEGLLRGAAPSTGMEGFIPDPGAVVQAGNGGRDLGVVVISPVDRPGSGVVVTRGGKPALGAEVVHIALALLVDVIASPVVVTGQQSTVPGPVIDLLPVGFLDEFQVGVEVVRPVFRGQRSDVKMLRRDSAGQFVTMLLLKGPGQRLGVDVARGGGMFILENAHETVTHRVPSESALELAVEHVDKGLRGGVAEVEGLIRNRGDDGHAPGPFPRGPRQDAPADLRSDIPAPGIACLAIDERIRPGRQEFSFGQFQLERGFRLDRFTEKRDACGARVLDSRCGLLQPSVMAITDLVVGPECHAEAFALLVDVHKHRPPLGCERGRIAASRGALDGADGLHSFSGQFFQFRGGPLPGHRFTFPPPQGHLAPKGMVRLLERGAEFIVAGHRATVVTYRTGDGTRQTDRHLVGARVPTTPR